MMTLFGIFVLIVGVPCAVLVAALGLFGLARATGSVVAGFVGAAGLLGAGSFGIGMAALRLVNVPSTSGALVIAALVVVVTSMWVRAAVLRPLGIELREIADMPDVRFWTRPDGLPVAYLRLAGEGKENASPIVYLHGGPGGYAVTPGTRDLFSPLAQRGFDVYLYDQVGSGRSGRPTRISSQSIEQHVQDLEFVRQQIGARRMVLVGQSWGACLAAEYAALFPQHVERLVLTSPGGLSNETRRDKRNLHLEAEHQRAMDRLQAQPRAIFVILLAQLVGPDAARRFAPDREMDAWFDAFTDYVSLGSRHLSSSTSLSQNVGAGFYANQTASRDARRRLAPISRLAELDVPTLVLIGESDYLGWSGRVKEYRSAFPKMSLLLVPGAGHALGLDRPELHSEAITAFLRGTPLPLPEVVGTERPAVPEGTWRPEPA